MYKEEGAIFDFYISCWGDISQLKGITLVIGDLTFCSENLLEAIDLLFKVVRSLQKNFPVCAKPIWQFIEKVCYSLPVENVLECVIKLAQSVGRPLAANNISRKNRAPVSLNKRVQAENRRLSKRGRRSV